MRPAAKELPFVLQAQQQALLEAQVNFATAWVCVCGGGGDWPMRTQSQPVSEFFSLKTQGHS